MSQKLSFEQLRRGAGMDLAACLQMENRMVRVGGWGGGACGGQLQVFFLLCFSMD